MFSLLKDCDVAKVGFETLSPEVGPQRRPDRALRVQAVTARPRYKVSHHPTGLAIALALIVHAPLANADPPPPPGSSSTPSAAARDAEIPSFLGIGEFHTIFDHTTESFVVNDFFRTTPLTVGGTVLAPRLVARPIDTALGIAGVVGGRVCLRRPPGAGAEERISPMIFDYDLTLRTAIWARGRRRQVVTMRCSGATEPADPPPPDLRAVVLRDCIQQLHTHLAISAEDLLSLIAQERRERRTAPDSAFEGTRWLPPGELQAVLRQRRQAGLFPEQISGRTEAGRTEFRVSWFLPWPCGQWDARYNLTEAEYQQFREQAQNVGAVEYAVQRFQDERGTIRFQSVWMR